MTEKHRGVSDRSHTLNEMLQVKPPTGTKMYLVEDGKETPGVTDFAHGLIHTFNEVPGGAPDYAEGTLIQFNPGLIVTHVARRGLSSDEVNKIGALAAQLDSDMAYSGFVPSTLQIIDQLIKNLRQSVAHRNPAITTTNELDSQIEESLSGLGILVEVLKEQNLTVAQKMKEGRIELDDLGVVLVTSKTGNLGSGIPIRRFKEDRQPQEQQAA